MHISFLAVTCSKLQERVFLVFKEYYYNEIRILYHPPLVVTDAELIPTDPLQEGSSWSLYCVTYK